MTENDRLLLVDFRGARQAHDAGDQNNPDVLDRYAETLKNLQYLDDSKLKALAVTARLDFGCPENWPESKGLHERCKAAELELIAALNPAAD